MKKLSRRILFVWMLIAAVAAGGTFLIVRRPRGGSTSGIPQDSDTNLAAQPDADIQSDVSPSDVATATVTMQTFSNEGYAFNVPASWSIEKTGTDTVAVRPDVSSSGVACKIEVSAFPSVAGEDVAEWISHRIGADPSLVVVERSTENVSLGSGTAVKWTGTIDGVPTTLVYAFNNDHAYEIAPSVIGDAMDGSGACDDVLEAFLSGLKI
jgi:hypothetical protein